MIERILARTVEDPQTGCWLWTAAKTGAGYGAMRTKRHAASLAHREAWEAWIGPIPAGMHVCHRCDVPCCVNPAHLFLGTHADNMADRNAKGRQASRETHWATRLTERDVAEIRWLLADGLPHRAIGRLFGVTNGAISGISTGRTWKAAG